MVKRAYPEADFDAGLASLQRSLQQLIDTHDQLTPKERSRRHDQIKLRFVELCEERLKSLDPGAPLN